MSTVSMKYLYVIQKPDHICSVTIYNTNSIIRGLGHVKFLLPHYHNDPLSLVDNFLTTHGILFIPFNPPSIGGNAVIKAKTYELREKAFPLADLYLALGHIQSEVLLRFDERINNSLDKISVYEAEVAGLKTSFDVLKNSLTSDIQSFVSYVTTVIHEMAIDTFKTSIQDELVNIKTIVSEQIEGVIQEINKANQEINKANQEIMETRSELSHKHFINDEYFADQNEVVEDDEAELVEDPKEISQAVGEPSEIIDETNGQKNITESRWLGWF